MPEAAAAGRRGCTAPRPNPNDSRRWAAGALSRALTPPALALRSQEKGLIRPVVQHAKQVRREDASLAVRLVLTSPSSQVIYTRATNA